MKRIVLLVSFVLAGGVSTAFADHRAPPTGAGGPRAGQVHGPGEQRQHHRPRLPRQVREQLLRRFDRDGDGRLDRRERRAARRFVMQLRQQRRAGR